MGDVSIKVTIAGRVYPLTVDEKEKELIENAAERVDNIVRMFMKNYAVKDKQDLLAMSALQLATSKGNASGGNENEVTEKLLTLESLLDAHLAD